MTFDNNSSNQSMFSTVSEFATPSEVLAVVDYVAQHYLFGAECRLIDCDIIELTYLQMEYKARCKISPLTGSWTETLPDERLVLRGVVCESVAIHSYKRVNQLNSENSDIKLFIDTNADHIILERVFSMVGGATINNLIETILEFTASQSLLRKALS